MTPRSYSRSTRIADGSTIAARMIIRHYPTAQPKCQINQFIHSFSITGLI